MGLVNAHYVQGHQPYAEEIDCCTYQLEARQPGSKGSLASTPPSLFVIVLANTHQSTGNTTLDASNPMDKLLAKLSEQQNALTKQRDALHMTDGNSKEQSVQGSNLHSEANTISFSSGHVSGISVTKDTTAVDSPTRQPTKTEILRLKIELEKARGKIAAMDQELTQTRITKHTIEQAIGGNSDVDYTANQRFDASESKNTSGAAAMNYQGRNQSQAETAWGAQDDGHSDISDTRSMNGVYNSNTGGAIWGASARAPYNSYAAGGSGYQSGASGYQSGGPGYQSGNSFAGNGWMGRGIGVPFHDDNAASYQQGMSSRSTPDIDNSMGPMGNGRNNYRGRGGYMSRNNSFPYASSNSSYDGMVPAYGSVAGMGGGVGNSMGGSMGMGGLYQPQPIGTPLSPFAPEFTSASAPWKNDVSYRAPPRAPKAMRLTPVKANSIEAQTYLPTTEPLNYRRLLDRTVNCNWKYIVDKIVGHNDQQASIFLQQKLKVGTTEQKYDIVEAIVAQAYPLMVNRFGNFLVQRCFEHGTPEQVIKIAEAIRGNTLNLSMDAFGCHVVQKAFDSVPEDYKAIMVHELLRRIPETVIHRYACHVWQKLFELRWAESPPQIMKYVNEALRGMWHEVALGETGSLVVQNIFENCLEEDKVCYAS